MFKPWTPKSALWALDFGERSVVALAGREAGGRWQILGRGEAPAHGRVQGEVVKIGDVVESVLGALRQAEQTAGLHCGTLHFNFDDPEAVSAHPSGSKTLAGEGQIRREDVREAARSAARLVGDFERASVYTREVDYLIDGKDSVRNPFGVFGHRLDVTLHVVLARARVLEQWRNVMRRAQIRRFAAVLSLDSACHAVLGRAAGPSVVWDLGEDVTSGGVFDHGLLREYVVFSAGLAKSEAADRIDEASRLWAERYSIPGHVQVTGDFAGKLPLKLKWETARPANIPEFTEPAQASLAGLLEAASRREKRAAIQKSGGQWAGRVREKANTLIQEYF